MKKRVIIMGAAGRDFHNFNVFFRDNEDYEVVAFTAAQIPNIEDKLYPPELSGKLYPRGIPVHSEDDLPGLIKEMEVDLAVFSYSDISHEYVMHKASLVNAAGADFWLLGPKNTMIKTEKPLVSVCAVRTGCGKSLTTKTVIKALKDKGLKTIAVRHPMPYGDLNAQKVQRFESYEDLDLHKCTIEEREEYETHIDLGNIIYAGVDYEAILREAEKEADVIVWEGGNNDTPFYCSDRHFQFVVVDPHRAGHELAYYPGETNLHMADAMIINKIESSSLENILKVRDSIHNVNPQARVIEGSAPLTVDQPDLIKGKRVLIVEDGPTVTHGEMAGGWGNFSLMAKSKFGVSELVDPRQSAVGSIIETFEKNPHIGMVLPAMGYGDEQVAELEKTINNADCEVVVTTTPIDITRVVKIDKPVVRVHYQFQEIGQPTVAEVLKDF